MQDSKFQMDLIGVSEPFKELLKNYYSPVTAFMIKLTGDNSKVSGIIDRAFYAVRNANLKNTEVVLNSIFGNCYDEYIEFKLKNGGPVKNQAEAKRLWEVTVKIK